MSYQEEDRSRLRRQSTKQAIALAMEGSWKEAVAVNREIIEIFPHDIEALNRQGRAHLELGEYEQAEEAYRRTIKIDPYNGIALKNLQRLSRLKAAADVDGVGAGKLEPQSFIKEVGKVGIVQLTDPAPPEVIARLSAGDRVELRSKASSLIVETTRGEYLGQVELGHGQRLIQLIEGGNRYTAAIVSIADDSASVIIREVYQHPSQVGRVSFPSRGLGSRTISGDRVIRRGLEQEAGLAESGYTVVGGGVETELLVEESLDIDDEIIEEE